MSKSFKSYPVRLTEEVLPAFFVKAKLLLAAHFELNYEPLEDGLDLFSGPLMVGDRRLVLDGGPLFYLLVARWLLLRIVVACLHSLVWSGTILIYAYPSFLLSNE